MRNIILIAVLAAGLFAIAGPARAELCAECRQKGFTADVGTCKECGGFTSSGAFKLCRACSARLSLCEACGKALPKTKPAADAAKTPRKPEAGAEVVVEKSANGKTVEARVGQTVVVRLPGNATTGFRWALAKGASDVVKPLGEPEYLQRASSVVVVGAGGTYVFRLRAAKAGTATLTFEYARPWEKKTPPAETLTVTLRVLEPPKPAKPAPAGKAK